LPEDTFLPDDLLRQLMSVGEVDLLVGISSRNPAAPIHQAIQVIEQSLQQNFMRLRVVIVLMDGVNKDSDGVAIEQAENALQNNRRSPGITSLRTIHKVTASFLTEPLPGVALRTTLAVADLLRARACAVVTATSTSLTTDSLARLLTPAYREKFDYVAPLYRRHKFQGLLIRNLLYPMSRAVFGCPIREIYPSEWGFSANLAAHCLNQNVWNEEAIRARPEAWMAISAVTSDYRCCQAYLGDKGPLTGATPNIVDILRQTVGGLFWCFEKDQDTWLDRDKTASAPTFGPAQELTSEPTEMDRRRIFEMFRSGVTNLEPVLSSILDSETHAEMKSIVELEEGKFRFRPDLWVRTLYDFAASYHHAVINRDHIVQALAPLYRGMTHSFLLEHADSSPAEIEAADEMLCSEFELQKPYLKERWKAKVEVKS
jgi:glucosylglycerate synthase